MYYCGNKVPLSGGRSTDIRRSAETRPRTVNRFSTGFRSLAVRFGREGGRPNERPLPGKTRSYGLSLSREEKEPKGFFFFGWGKVSQKLRTEGDRESGVAQTFYRPSSGWAPAGLGNRFRKTWGGVQGVLKAAALIAMIGLAAWGKNQVLGRLQEASGFKLSRVTVEGNRFMRGEDLVRASGLPFGENMFRLDLTGAAQKLEKLDWVERAFLERRLPQTVLISVKERQVTALFDGGALYGITKDGRVLTPSDGLARMDLPLLSGLRVTPEALGTTLMASALQPGLDFLAFMGKQGEDWAQEISEVNLSDPRALKVTFIDGVTATFDPPVTAEQVHRLGLVCVDLARKGLRAGTMDFRYKDTVLVRLAGKGA